MSIIYDALKKVDKEKVSHGEGEFRRPPFKQYFVYGMVVFLGVVIAHFSFKLLVTHKETFTRLGDKQVSQKTKVFSSRKPPEVVPSVTPSSVADAVPPSPPAQAVSPTTESLRQTPSSLVLSGVFFSENEGYALINNRILKQGDTIDGARLIKVGLDAVELEFKGETFKLTARK
jgi:type II secretory pathway component PulC